VAWWPVVLLSVLVVCVVVAVGVGAYRSGKRSGNAERCGRHSHAEMVAADRFEAAQPGTVPSRVSTADLGRPQRIWEGDPD
jgi:hypothetical protein